METIFSLSVSTSKMAGEYWSRKEYNHSSLRKIRLVCRLIDGKSQKLHLLVHELIGHDAAWNYGRSTLDFHFFFFFNKCPFKHANVELQPALPLSRPAPGILDNFLCRVNVCLFSIGLSFYWVLIVSGSRPGQKADFTFSQQSIEKHY